MSTRALIAALCLGLAGPTAALAQTPSGGSQPTFLAAIEQRLAAEGFRVLEIERYAHSIEVKGYDSAGRCTELHLDPATGEILRRERDDDCSRSRGDDDRHHGRDHD